jgi:predicted PurR-regulated permease PerM
MMAIDDRTANVLTTIALFVAVVAAAFLARTTLLVFILAMLLAYLLEPIVAAIERRLPWHAHARACAIALVYILSMTLVVVAAYTAAPKIAADVRRLENAAPEMAARVNETLGGHHGDVIETVVTRATSAVSVQSGEVVWLLLVPVVAIFFLGRRTAFLDDAVTLFARRGDRAAATLTIQRIDEALAEYARAQLTLSGLSALYYTVAMLVLGFPYPLALGLIAGALELVPMIGWMTAAAAMLASGWLADAPWMWMAALILVWRGVQNFVNSPRVTGSRLKMEPITVLFALLVGGQLGGPPGVLLAVPTVAVARIICDERRARDAGSRGAIQACRDGVPAGDEDKRQQ